MSVQIFQNHALISRKQWIMGKGYPLSLCQIGPETLVCLVRPPHWLVCSITRHRAKPLESNRSESWTMVESQEEGMKGRLSWPAFFQPFCGNCYGGKNKCWNLNLRYEVSRLLVPLHFSFFCCFSVFACCSGKIKSNSRCSVLLQGQKSSRLISFPR